jgi:hypothetical protein
MRINVDESAWALEINQGHTTNQKVFIHSEGKADTWVRAEGRTGTPGTGVRSFCWDCIYPTFCLAEFCQGRIKVERLLNLEWGVKSTRLLASSAKLNIETCNWGLRLWPGGDQSVKNLIGRVW